MKYWHSNLLKLRAKSGLSQEKLSEKLGINRPRYASYEEYRCEPNIDLIIKICDFYKVKIDDFLTKDLWLSIYYKSKISSLKKEYPKSGI